VPCHFEQIIGVDLTWAQRSWEQLRVLLAMWQPQPRGQGHFLWVLRLNSSR
jgi:hypothetical protein